MKNGEGTVLDITEYMVYWEKKTGRKNGSPAGVPLGSLLGLAVVLMKGVSMEDFEGRMSLELRLQVGRRKECNWGMRILSREEYYR